MDKIESPWSDSRSILKRMHAFVDEHRDQDVQMWQRGDYMLFKIGRQTEDVGLTVDINDH
jgi:hypothetical protein